MSLNYSRQLNRMELKQIQMEMMLKAILQQTVADPKKIAQIEANLEAATAELQSAIDEASPPESP